MTTTISLTEADSELLRSLAEDTGKPHEELVHEGLDLLREKIERERRREVFRRTQGLWKDRDDIPGLFE